MLIGRLMKLVGDLIVIATIAFVGTVAVVRNVRIVWPNEVEPVLRVADFMRAQFGVAWWGVVIVLGVVLGWAVGGIGKRAVDKAGVQWGGYH